MQEQYRLMGLRAPQRRWWAVGEGSCLQWSPQEVEATPSHRSNPAAAARRFRRCRRAAAGVEGTPSRP